MVELVRAQSAVVLRPSYTTSVLSLLPTFLLMFEFTTLYQLNVNVADLSNAISAGCQPVQPLFTKMAISLLQRLGFGNCVSSPSKEC
uniref:Uncharacterized protein n=1 Tax=Setaria digitata TaxID=48799 RepID=A0A915PUM5_9BILA